MKYFRVSLCKSLIGVPNATRAVAASLGLRRMHKPRYIAATKENAGSVLKLRALVTSTVHEFDTKHAMKTHVKNEKQSRKPPDGFIVRVNHSH